MIKVPLVSCNKPVRASNDAVLMHVHTIDIIGDEFVEVDREQDSIEKTPHNDDPSHLTAQIDRDVQLLVGRE